MSKYVKGQSGNPKGVPRPSPEDKTIKHLTQYEFRQVFSEFIGLTKEQIIAISKDPNSTALRLMVASVLVKAINNGDADRLEYFIQRIAGKMKENVHLSGSLTNTHELGESVKPLLDKILKLDKEDL